jgi:hypothetical protein
MDSWRRNSTNVLFAIVVFAVAICAAYSPAGQNTPPPAEKAPARPEAPNRLTIQVTGGEKGKPIENASVYLTYEEEHAIKKNKKIELNVKTNHEGVAHIPDAPLGRARLQIIADGWKTYGRYYDITDPKQVIQVRLEKPPKWY